MEYHFLGASDKHMQEEYHCISLRTLYPFLIQNMYHLLSRVLI